MCRSSPCCRRRHEGGRTQAEHSRECRVRYGSEARWKCRISCPSRKLGRCPIQCLAGRRSDFPEFRAKPAGNCRSGRPKNGPVGAACLIEWLINQSDKPQFSSSMVAVAKQRKPRFPDSGKLPTLGQIIRDARGDQQIIRRATRQALRAWFRQSEPLNIARREYRSRGPHRLRPTHGITGQTSAHHLVHLLSRLGNRVGLVSPDRRA